MYGQPFVDQLHRDNAVKDLLDIIDDTYTFILTADSLKDLDQRRKSILANLSKQTIECAYFIRDYAKSSAFCEYYLCSVCSFV